MTDPKQTLEEKSNADFVSDMDFYGRNLLTIVTRFPDKAGPELKAAIQNLIETDPYRISGFTNSVTATFHGNGTVQSVERNQSYPVFWYKEMTGRARAKAFEAWCRVGGDISIDVMIIEPDATGRNPVSVWNCTKFRPTSIEAPESLRDLDVRTSRQAETLNVTFSYDEAGGSAEDFAKAASLLNKLNVVSANPFAPQG